MQFMGYRPDTDLIMHWGSLLLQAAIILVVTWLLARAAKWAFAKLVDNISFFKKQDGSGESIGLSLGKIASMLIWLFGLIAVLQLFTLDNVIAPLTTLLNKVMNYLPNLIGAAVIFFVGLLVAKIVRQLVEQVLQTVNFDKWANRGGMETVTGNATISKTIATILYALVVIVVSIAALQALQITVISDPAENMLNAILNAIPNIIGAAIVLAIGFLIARFTGKLIRDVLPGLGVDRSLGALDVLPATTKVSDIVAKVAEIAIMLFAAIAATRMLNFPELTMILDRVLELGGRVVFGGVIIAFGFIVANIIAKIIAGTGDGGLAATIVKYATIILFVAMGLKFMGIADSIIEMAFGALVIGGAVAGALAFGLGGREAAARTLAKMEAKADAAKIDTPSSPAANTPPGTPPTTPAE